MPQTSTPLTNWAGNVTFGAARVHRPTSLDELRRLVAGSRRVRALGSGHSFNLLGATPGDLVMLDQLPPTVRVDESSSKATVGAGMRYGEVAAELHRAGFALANMASLPHISIGGSCATGTHGSGDRQQCLAAEVIGLRLVEPGGQIVEFSRDKDGDVFAGTVVALGAIGIVTELILGIQPTFEVAQTVLLDVPLASIEAEWDRVFGAAYSVSVFTDYASGMASVWLKRRCDQPSGDWPDGRPADEDVHPVPGAQAAWCTPQRGLPGPWHERLPHFLPGFVPGAGDELQSEYFLPRAAGPAALAALATIAARVAPVIHIAELRSVRADDLWLSSAYGRDTATFHFTWIRDFDAVRPVIDAVEELLVPLGARPHWGKLTGLAPGEVIADYPRAADFERLVLRLDPGGKFGNAFVDAMFPRLADR